MKTLAIFGGSFDPVHLGHIRSAQELVQRLDLNEFRFLPSHRPPHKTVLTASAQQRMAMVELAINEVDTSESKVLSADDRELRRDGISYSVETVEQIRAEVGGGVSLVWVMGTDSFATLNTWHRWRELLTMAHIVVMTRPDSSLPTTGSLAELIAECSAVNASDLKSRSAGLIRFEQLQQYPISATNIRRTLGKLLNKEVEPDVAEAVKLRRDLEKLLPVTVLNFIDEQKLYC